MINRDIVFSFADNKYDIEFTLSGTDLLGDINMYKFSKVTVDCQQISLDDLERT